MEKKLLGIITIGQSPRTDLTEDFRHVLNEHIQMVEMGVLDHYDKEEVEKKFKARMGMSRLVTRMRDGTQVIVDEEKIIDELQKRILEIDLKVDMTLLLCTGRFPRFISRKPLIMPKPIINALVGTISEGEKIGVVIPHVSQKEQIENGWKEANVPVETVEWSPYKDNHQHNKIKFEDDKIEYIVLDCMGYTSRMKRNIEAITGKHVILPRTLLGSIINEII